MTNRPTRTGLHNLLNNLNQPHLLGSQSSESSGDDDDENLGLGWSAGVGLADTNAGGQNDIVLPATRRAGRNDDAGQQVHPDGVGMAPLSPRADFLAGILGLRPIRAAAANPFAPPILPTAVNPPRPTATRRAGRNADAGMLGHPLVQPHGVGIVTPSMNPDDLAARRTNPLNINPIVPMADLLGDPMGVAIPFAPPILPTSVNRGAPTLTDLLHLQGETTTGSRRDSASTLATSNAVATRRGKRPRDGEDKANAICLDDSDDDADEGKQATDDFKEGVEKSVCCICLENPRTHAAVPCGHKHLCGDCKSHVEQTKKCPTCRAPIYGVMKIFD